MSNIYKFEDIQILADKISKIRNKKILERIRDTIVRYNKNIKITENTNGLFLRFHNLENETYIKLDNIIKKYNKTKKSRNLNSTISQEYMTQSSDPVLFSTDSRLKYSNKEKNIIKRKNYDKVISENTDSYIIKSDTASNIFIKKK